MTSGAPEVGEDGDAVLRMGRAWADPGGARAPGHPGHDADGRRGQSFGRRVLGSGAFHGNMGDQY